MSDVDKTISGLDDGEHFGKNQQLQQQQQLTTNIPTKTSNLKYNPHQHHHRQQQQQQQQHFHQPQQQQQQPLNFYKDIAAGNSALTDSTIAKTNAHSTTTSTPPSSPSTSSSSCRNNCISNILKLIFSTPGLVLLVVGYSVLGALIFPLLEAPQDITKSAAIAKSREDCLRELWIITEKLNVLYERNWTMLVHEQLRRFEGTIVAATRNGGTVGMISNSNQNTAIGRFGANLDTFEQARWSFSEALLYSVTVITTIGHGNLTPKTAAGKIATILYALIGVPLMLMCLSSLGALLAEALQCTYAKICCRLSITHERKTNENENERIHDKNDGVKRQGHYNKENDNNKKSQRDNDCKCHSKGQGFNCKNCKYDAITSEKKFHHCYDYNETNSNSENALERGRMDESCRLLHSSPKTKINHNSNSPCMQLKMMPQQQQQQHPTATLKQYYHQQQKQKSQPQPPPDVMLLATKQKISPIPLTTAPTATTTETNAATNITRPIATTHSPQHLTHPLQSTTTFHIVSNATSPQFISSTHSSPIHYNHQQPHQMSHQQHQLTMRHNVPQHFVAIPSSMVRFQIAPLASSSSTSSPSNCYQPTASASVTATNAAVASSASAAVSASVNVTGAATIYFPIAGATTTMPRTSTSIVGGSTSHLLCNQPLVKYHTIQLQHKKPITATTTIAGTTTTTTMTNILNDEQQQQQSLLSTSGTLRNSTENAGALNVADALPLPPPPAYQTATVHGVRRAKLIAKPMPPEINTLVLAESDVNTTSFRHDLSTVEQQQNMTTTISEQITAPTTITPTPTATTTTNLTPSTTIQNRENILLLSTGVSNYTTTSSSLTTTNTATTTSMPVAHNLATAQGVENLIPTLIAHPSLATTTTTYNGNPILTDSNVTVDIMEDEEEDERLVNCPHGTPSRIPLLGGSGNNSGSNEQNRDYDKPTRGLINATAASFNRHTFQRNNNCFNRKSTLVTHHNDGNLQTSAIWLRRSSAGGVGGVDGVGGCYGIDSYVDTSEDDENFALAQFRHSGNNLTDDIAEDNDDTEDELEQCPSNTGPQVPISIVLVILVCYISLGTVIFALWENWSLIDGAYFCFVTLATIGYGDFMPERTFQGPEVQLFACCAYLLLGLVLVAMSFSILETQLMWKCRRIAVRLRLAKD